jgi:hypothetical protein
MTVEALADRDLFGLRLAGQVLGHKAALARRGVGVVLVRQAELGLAAEADASDRQLLAEYLGLLAANDALSDGQRAFCRSMLEGLAS